MQYTIEQYKKLYDVEVQIVLIESGSMYYSLTEYSERVANDLAGGTGPDVLFLNYLDSMDIAKAALNGSFTDLTDILAGDSEFSRDDYIDTVFESGRIGGRQYIIPISFFPTLYLSAQSKLEDLEFSWERIESTSDFLEEISRLTPYAKQDAWFVKMMASPNNFREFFQASGISLLDYENNVVLPDEEDLSEFLHAYKTYFPYDDDSISPGGSVDSLTLGQLLFWSVGFIRTDSILRDIDSMKKANFDYELGFLPSQTGGMAGVVFHSMAIRANSPNQLNAYNFIKMMLSEEIQRDDWLRPGSYPVHKEALRKCVYGSYRGSISIEGNTHEYSGYKSAALSDEDLDAFIETIVGIDQLVQPISYHFYTTIFDTMLPFFKDERGYEDCLAVLRNKLTLYLSE